MNMDISNINLYLYIVMITYGYYINACSIAFITMGNHMHFLGHH